ncbi:MAG: hypothetical protein DME50_08085 [Verrucomicrobia bacterium]|nr:MAG: hypothetical protein DME50_08085 [Verrucomicrobiota bacterium]
MIDLVDEWPLGPGPDEPLHETHFLERDNGRHRLLDLASDAGGPFCDVAGDNLVVDRCHTLNKRCGIGRSERGFVVAAEIHVAGHHTKHGVMRIFRSRHVGRY